MRSQVLARGTATVASVTGGLQLASGASCSWRQIAVSPDSGFDCQWEVRCGDLLLYGGAEGGYNPVHDESWPAGARVHDANTTGDDGDPSFVFGPEGMRVRDDASGPNGAFEVVLTPE